MLIPYRYGRGQAGGPSLTVPPQAGEGNGRPWPGRRVSADYFIKTYFPGASASAG